MVNDTKKLKFQSRESIAINLKAVLIFHKYVPGAMSRFSYLPR